MNSEVTGFAIEWFSKLYPPEVNIPHDMIPESKVPYSSNNISRKDLPWMKGVKSDIKKYIVKMYDTLFNEAPIPMYNPLSISHLGL